MTEIREKLKLPAGRVVVKRITAVDRETAGGAIAPNERRREGHDALLKALSGKKTLIRIVMMDGSEVFGRLDQSDRFTITVYQCLNNGENEKATPVIVFKHAIATMRLDTTGNR